MKENLMFPARRNQINKNETGVTQAETESLIFLQDWNLKRGRKSCCWSVSHIFNHVSMLFIPIKKHFQRIKWDPIKHAIISYKNKRFYPALRTAPVQLKDAAAPLFRNGDWWPWCWWCPPVSDSPPSSSSLTAVVRDSRSSSDIYKKEEKGQDTLRPFFYSMDPARAEDSASAGLFPISLFFYWSFKANEQVRNGLRP